MKIKKMAQIVKKEGRMRLLDVVKTESGEVQQWIEARSCAYPLTGLPHMTASQVMTMLELAEDDVMVSAQTYTGNRFDDLDKNDTVLEASGVRICTSESDFLLLCGLSGYVTAVQEKMLGPLGTKEIEYVDRGEAVGLMDGMMLVGIVAKVVPLVSDDAAVGVMRMGRAMMEKAQEND